MSVQGNLTQNVQDLAAATDDTVIHNQTARTAISTISLYNTQGSEREVKLYESPDDDSSNGKEIATYTIQPNSSIIPIEAIQGYQADYRLIAVQQTGGAALGDVNAKITYIDYTDGS